MLGSVFQKDLHALCLVLSSHEAPGGISQEKLGTRHESERRRQSPLGCLRTIKGDYDTSVRLIGRHLCHQHRAPVLVGLLLLSVKWASLPGEDREWSELHLFRRIGVLPAYHAPP